MVTEYSVEIANLEPPTILETLSYAEILKQNVELFKNKNSAYQLELEDDDVMPLLEAFAYRELHLRATITQKVKNMMPHYAEGTDLDNFVFAFYGGITRVAGAYPYANFRFTLEDEHSLTIPNGTIVKNKNGDRGRVVTTFSLSSSTPSSVQRVELLHYAQNSSVELSSMDDFYHVKVEQLESFSNGAVREDDERFRERALLSFNRFSTAGAIGSYYYHIMTADVRIDTAYVYSPSPGVVRIVLDDFNQNIDAKTIEKIDKHLNADKVRPLTDKPEVRRAKQVELTIQARVNLFDLSTQAEVDRVIQNAFNEPFKISEDLTYSDVVQRLHVAGVYSVEMLYPTQSIVCDDESRIVIKEVACVYHRANV